MQATHLQELYETREISAQYIRPWNAQSGWETYSYSLQPARHPQHTRVCCTSECHPSPHCFHDRASSGRGLHIPARQSREENSPNTKLHAKPRAQTAMGWNGSFREVALK